MYKHSCKSIFKSSNMKKLFYFAAAAVALAACAKNEVIPVNSGENQEITFNVAPKTKADPQPQTFSTDNVFASWAYYLPNGTTGAVTKWSDEWTVRQGAKPYISGSEISWNNGVWKNATTSYYWPEDGRLTFFAYSLNRKNFTLVTDSGHTYPIECHNEENAYGINATIDLKDNQNLDLLVAEIAPDKTQNETLNSINGVPTLFKHKFSRVQFAVKKKEDYKNVTITLTSIKFNNVAYTGHYCQYNKVEGTFVKDYCAEGDIRETITYKGTPFVVESSTDFVPVTETNETIYIYMPQTFKDETDVAGVENGENKIATIDVAYTLTYDNGFSENRARTLKVKNIFERWEVGKKYTFNLILSLNEITWAPAVEEWESVPKEIEIK